MNYTEFKNHLTRILEIYFQGTGDPVVFRAKLLILLEWKEPEEGWFNTRFAADNICDVIHELYEWTGAGWLPKELKGDEFFNTVIDRTALFGSVQVQGNALQWGPVGLRLKIPTDTVVAIDSVVQFRALLEVLINLTPNHTKKANHV